MEGKGLGCLPGWHCTNMQAVLMGFMRQALQAYRAGWKGACALALNCSNAGMAEKETCMLWCRDAVAGGGPQLNITTVDVSFRKSHDSTCVWLEPVLLQQLL